MKKYIFLSLLLAIPFISFSQIESATYSIDTISIDSFYLVETISKFNTPTPSKERPVVLTVQYLFTDTTQLNDLINLLKTQEQGLQAKAIEIDTLYKRTVEKRETLEGLRDSIFRSEMNYIVLTPNTNFASKHKYSCKLAAILRSRKKRKRQQ